VNGQWIGSYSGSTGGTIVVNVDERELNYQGVAYLHPQDSALPTTAAYFKTPSKETAFQFRTELIHAIHPDSGNAVPWEAVKQRFPGTAAFSNYADVTGSWSDESLTLSWQSDIGGAGSCILPRSNVGKPSDLPALKKNWAEFKEYVSNIKTRRYLFRGQVEPWRLRTSFHRTGRADLSRFLREDVVVLHRALSGRTRHLFKLEIPDELGAFLSLIQHHGYPTPLLDWTYSPYVAAFFAYREMSNGGAARSDPDDKVRVHILDQEAWKTWAPVLLLVSPTLHLSIAELLAIENQRMIPQQSVSTVTSVDDIESYIQTKESETTKYLSAIDLPVRERGLVIRELSYMGITAGSLFPGLDGACEELKERNFEI
jgi:hypothetical protein